MNFLVMRLFTALWLRAGGAAAIRSRSSRLLSAALLVAVLHFPRPCAAQTASPTPGSSDSGVFEILSGQHRIGTESFQIRPDGPGWEASGELQLEPSGGAKVSVVSKLELDSTLRPVSYVREQKSPKPGKLAVQFGSPETSLVSSTGTGDPVEEGFYLPSTDLAVLDTNCFHHYALLLRLYDAAKGGSQPFNVFVPQEALPGTIQLQLVGKESVSTGGQSRELNHYHAVTEEIQIELWATPDGALYRLTIPQADLEVVRR